MDSVEECGKPGHRRSRPSSLDLNVHGQNMAVSSLHPLSADDAYTKNSLAISTCSRSNLFPSPGTPNYAGVSSYQKGWSSERIALSADRGRRYGANALMFPFSNGRTMPSKWEDAEKWICSPVSSDGLRRPLILPRYQRRPKSKSGPLGTPAFTGGACPSALADDRVDSIKEPATMLSHTTMRRDVGTQMSPEGSIPSSPKEGPSLCLSPSASCTTTDLESHFSCLEISNVKVDNRGSVAKWSKKHISWCSDKSSTDIIEWKRKTVESPASDYEVVVTEDMTEKRVSSCLAKTR
ncbi:uncharacterized protein LOC110028972 isoform X2 [Phalaenopsis equestris]|uniref:uncharacterized protein LOC110028972 isoform X2 n=1 Tax=Phalaenopsis equestris TaxID=78828 RepID=UPI0009E1FD40|nr:uncharacterized protein LOC110028972 isoform X2 [Phalaenopsis equestris]